MNRNGRAKLDLDRGSRKSGLLHLCPVQAKRQPSGDEHARVVRHERIREVVGIAHQLNCSPHAGALRIFNFQMQLCSASLPEYRQCHQEPDEMGRQSHNDLRES